MAALFKCKETDTLFKVGKSAVFSGILKPTTRKSTILEAAETADFLCSPLGNQLEALVDHRAGQHSIRINDQWRLCFVWTDEGAKSAEIVDYH